MIDEPMLPLPEALLFDLDGTLFRTETLLRDAHERTFRELSREGLYVGEAPPVERMLASLGMLLTDIWQRVVPGADEAFMRRADVLFLHFETEGLRAGRGELYAGVKATLVTLRERGYRLFIASNGLKPYVEEVVRCQGIASLFEGLYSAGEYRTATKDDLVRILLDTHRPTGAWMIGDRSSDVSAGKTNGLPVIGCAYAGFGGSGELDGADRTIQTFPQLLEWLPRRV